MWLREDLLIRAAWPKLLAGGYAFVVEAIGGVTEALRALATIRPSFHVGHTLAISLGDGSFLLNSPGWERVPLPGGGRSIVRDA